MTGYFDSFLLVALPYLSSALFLVGLIHRCRAHNSSIVSPSSQFLERERHFWALVPLHYGLLGVLAIHLLGLLAPSWVLSWNSSTSRLYLLESLALSLGLLSLAGVGTAALRRFSTHRLFRLTRAGDWLVLLLVGSQVATGILVAVFCRWGTAWFAAAAGPYLLSLLTFSPQTDFMATAPWLVKLHFANAFLLIACIPYSKLIHALFVPVSYVWRSPIVFLWKKDRR